MEKKSKKLDDKKMDKEKDRGDKVNLLVKVLEELDIADFIPIRDRGDSSSRNIKEKSATSKGRPERPKKVSTSASEVKPKKQEHILDSDDSSKKHHGNVHKEKKKLEDSKDKTSLFKNHKIKTEAKARAYSEQLLKSNQDLTGLENTTKREEFARIDEKVRRTNDEAKRNENIRNMRLPPGKDLKFIDKDAIEKRKLLRDRYTVKLQGSNKNFETKDSSKYEVFNINYETNESSSREKSPKDNLKIETNKLAKKPKENTQTQRRPIIKTIKNNDHRVYKAVTFIDQREPTPLQIKMPNSKKSVETNTFKYKLKPITSKELLQDIAKEKPVKKKEKRGKRLKIRPSSPTLTTHQPCPQTEVAKWAPSSINQHTKPYYEAWVDTTLAAIAKCSEKEKQKVSNQHLFKTFKRALELDSRSSSLNLVYEKMNDEKYMGRIIVNKSK